jgi:hypothetical protein
MHASKCSLPGGNHTHVRIYECPACRHEMRLTVWGTDDLTAPKLASARRELDHFRPHAAPFGTGRERADAA